MPVRSCVLLLAMAGSAAAADWPQWQGPQRDGHSADTGLLKIWPTSGPKLLWSVQNLDTIGTGYGSPAVVGDRLYILGAESEDKAAKEFCTCLNTKDGSVVWKATLETATGGFSNGWGRGTRSTPTIDGDALYVLGPAGDLRCLSRAEGKVVWTKHLVQDFGGRVPTWGFSESPLVDGDVVVCTPGSKGGVVALNKKTGATVWMCSEIDDAAGYSSVVVATIGGVRQYIQQTMVGAVGVRAKDGKLLWKAGELKRRTAVIPTPIVHNDHVFLTAGYGAGCEVFRLTPDGEGTKATKVYTENKVMVNHHGGVVRVGEHVYGYSDGKGWVCFDFLKGGEDPVWAHNTRTFGKGSISYADGELYCYAEGDGTLVKALASPEGWKETGKLTIPKTSPTRPRSGKVWAHPVIANGKLYLRDYEHLYCYDVSSPTN